MMSCVPDRLVGREEELDRVVDLAATDPDRAGHAILPWREILTAGDDTEDATARRARAIRCGRGSPRPHSRLSSD